MKLIRIKYSEEPFFYVCVYMFSYSYESHIFLIILENIVKQIKGGHLKLSSLVEMLINQPNLVLF